MPPRTIDDLGVAVSTRYAEDQKRYDSSLIKESHAIPPQTSIEVTLPLSPSELDTLIQTAPLQLAWGSFLAPAFYAEQRKKLFTYQSIPSLGSEDRLESQTQKIQTKLHLIEEKVQKDKEEADKDPQKRRQLQQSLDQEEREKKILINLLNTIALLDKLIVDINSRRSQYHKG